MPIEVIPTKAALGAEIRGVDLAYPVDDTTFALIEEAYNSYGVIFFRGQSLAPPQQVAFTRRFGEIDFNIFGERWSVPRQSGNCCRLQHHREQSSSRCPPCRRKLAQRHVLHRSTAAGHDALCD